MLSDILAWSSTSRWTHPVGQSIAMRCFMQIIHPFIGDYTAELRHMMYSWGAVITGSCALQMLTGGHDTSRNLNLVVPMGSFEVLEKFIMNTLNYRHVEAVTNSNYAFCAVVQSFGKYRHGRLQITLCEALADDVFDVITSSPTTANMIFMTPGGIVALYAEWTLNGVALLNQMVASCIPGKNVGCMENDGHNVYDTTAFLNKPCGAVCLTLWRNMADGGPQSLVLEWDLRYPIRPSMAHSNTTWRLSEHCGNAVCHFNPSTNVRLARLPPVSPVTDHMSAKEQEARLRHHHPVCVMFAWSPHLC
jgi:hypothetical protein